MKTNKNLICSDKRRCHALSICSLVVIINAPCPLTYPAISKRLGLLPLSLDDADATIAETTSVGDALAATSTTWLFAGPDAAVFPVFLPVAMLLLHRTALDRPALNPYCIGTKSCYALTMVCGTWV